MATPNNADASEGRKDKTVLYSNVKDKALKSVALNSNELLGRGWKRGTYSSGSKANRPLWISPGRNIEFVSQQESFEFNGFCVMCSNNEFKAWPEYKEMKKYRKEPLRVRNPRQYDSKGEHDDASAEAVETDECYMCFDGGRE